MYTLQFTAGTSLKLTFFSKKQVKIIFRNIILLGVSKSYILPKDSSMIKNGRLGGWWFTPPVINMEPGNDGFQ